MTKNNNHNSEQKKLLHPVVITLVLMVLFIAGNAFGQASLTIADDAPAADSTVPLPVPEGATKQDVDAQVANACVTELTKFGDPEFEKYREFMENNFKNKSNTSSLLDLGMQRYELFKTDIANKYQQLFLQQLDLASITQSGNSTQAVGVNDCNLLALQYISDAAKVLQMRAYTTSSIKKTSIFVEKYKQINDKLKALNLEVMKMVVNLSTFEQKLPCYLKSCA